MNGQNQEHATADTMMSSLTGAPLNATKYMSECADYVRQHNIQERVEIIIHLHLKTRFWNKNAAVLVCLQLVNQIGL